MTRATERSLIDREKARVRLAQRVVVDGNGCHIFKGSTVSNGYGSISIEGVTWTTHRLAYELYHGPLPSGQGRVLVLHTCDVPACCNPKHLYLGSHCNNARDRADRCRMSAGLRLWSRKTPEEVGENFGTVFYEFRGDVRTLHSWAETLGLHPSTLELRFEAGYPENEISSSPHRGKRRSKGVTRYRRFSGVREAEEYLAEKAKAMN